MTREEIIQAVTRAGNDCQRLRDIIDKLTAKTGPVILAPPSNLLKQKCGNCFATIGYAPCDVRSHTYSDYGGGSDTSYTLTCPNCKKFIPIRNPHER